MTPVAVLVVSLALAVLYDGAVDARLAIGRTTIYGVLGFVFVVLFSVIENILTEALETRLGWPGTVGTAASAAIVAGIVIPLRGAVSRHVHRLLPFGERGWT